MLWFSFMDLHFIGRNSTLIFFLQRMTTGLRGFFQHLLTFDFSGALFGYCSAKPTVATMSTVYCVVTRRPF
jgi:hypothetical protein